MPGLSRVGCFFFEYRLGIGSLVTANQAKIIDDIINSLERSDLKWIKK